MKLCDEISNEFLKNLPEPALRTLQKAFNNIFETREIDESWANIDIKMLFKKGDREDPQNYRPIALENSSLKLLMNIINTRLMNWAEKNEVVPEYQNGFRPKRGCIDNIFIINCLIELTINQPTNNALFAVFIDFKGAFNSVKHHKLWKHLNDNKISTKMILLLEKVYNTAKIRIGTQYGKTELIKLILGLLQGDPSSPLLFNVFTNDLEKFFKARGFRGIKIANDREILLLAYADDIVLFSKSPTDLKDKLRTLEDYCKHKDLIINTDKTKIVIFKKRINKKLYQSFKLNGTTLEIVDEYKYLGIKLYRTGSWQVEMDSRTSAASFAFNELKSIILKDKSTSWSTKTTLVNSMVESILLYGSEIWGADDTDQIKKSQLKAYKTLLYLPQNTPGYAVIQEAKITSLDLLIKKHCLNWLKKLMEAPENSNIKLCYNKLLEDSTSNENWASKLKNKLFPENLEHIWYNQRITQNDIQFILDYHQQQETSLINEKINDSSSLYWYKFMDPSLDSYLHLNLPTTTINMYCQIRLLNRYNEKVYINGNTHKFNGNQICTICNLHEKDTLTHLLTKCNITNGLREEYFKSTNPEIELLTMLKSNTKEDILKVTSLIKNALRVRSFILFE
jgi:hypothetical protein